MTLWHEFLAAQGAVFSDGPEAHVISFGTPEQAPQSLQHNVLMDLSHLGLLELEGEDAVSFLQGQVTNDVKQLDGSTAQYAGYCNPKGRMLAMFLAFAHYGHVHLQLDGALRESVMKRLKMYVLRSKVSIKDVSDSIVRLAVAGPAAETALAALFARVPAQPMALVSLDNGALLRLPGPVPRYLVYCSADHAPTVWNALAPQFTPVGRNAWEWLEIQAGIPDVVPATKEAFVPQMVNLDALGGINFKKGCYTGQEIVARTHYLGKVKRRTQLAHLAVEEMPQPGQDLQAADGSEAGKIVRSAAAAEGGYDVLAELRLESLENGSVSWQGTALELKPLPYSLPSQG